MEDLSLHILDIAENSLRAGARNILIEIKEDMEKDILKIRIKDDGCGVTRKELGMISDPFFTTKSGKRFGMGLALLRQSAQEAGGKFKAESRKNRGTTVEASFIRSHLDRKPIGSVSKTLLSLIPSNPDVYFKFRHKIGNKTFELDTKDIKAKAARYKNGIGAIIKLLKERLGEFYPASS